MASSSTGPFSRFRAFLQGLKPGEIGFCIFSVGAMTASLLVSNKLAASYQQEEDAKKEAWRQRVAQVDRLVAEGAPSEGLASIKYYRKRIREEAIQIGVQDATNEELCDEWVRRRNRGCPQALEVERARLRLKRFWHSIESCCQAARNESDNKEERSLVDASVVGRSVGAGNVVGRPIGTSSSESKVVAASTTASTATAPTKKMNSSTTTRDASDAELAGEGGVPAMPRCRHEHLSGAGSSILQDLLCGGAGKHEPNDRLVLKTVMFLESLDKACCRGHLKCVWDRDQPSFYRFLREEAGVDRLMGTEWPGPYANDDDFDVDAPPTNSRAYLQHYHGEAETRLSRGFAPVLSAAA